MIEQRRGAHQGHASQTAESPGPTSRGNATPPPAAPGRRQAVTSSQSDGTANAAATVHGHSVIWRGTVYGGAPARAGTSVSPAQGTTSPTPTNGHEPSGAGPGQRSTTRCVAGSVRSTTAFIHRACADPARAASEEPRIQRPVIPATRIVHARRAAGATVGSGRARAGGRGQRQHGLHGRPLVGHR